MAQSKAKTPKRVANPKKRATHFKVPEAVRKPANQLIANLTGVMGKELLAEALVTIAGALVGGRYVRSQSASVGGDAAAEHERQPIADQQQQHRDRERTHDPCQLGPRAPRPSHQRARRTAASL